MQNRFHVEQIRIYPSSQDRSVASVKTGRGQNYSCHNLLITENSSTWNISGSRNNDLLKSSMWNKQSLLQKIDFRVKVVPRGIYNLKLFTQRTLFVCSTWNKPGNEIRQFLKQRLFHVEHTNQTISIFQITACSTWNKNRRFFFCYQLLLITCFTWNINILIQAPLEA